MNIQIVSSARNRECDVNYNNVFTMPLPEEIDVDNERKNIRILSVTYPQTIENVHEEECGIRLKYNFRGIAGGYSTYVKYQTHLMYVPAGHYSLNKLLRYLNELVDEYDMVFVIQEGGRIGVKFNGIPVLIEQNTANDDGVTWDTDFLSAKEIYLQPDLFSFEMTTALEYMLGLKDIIVHPYIRQLKVGHSLAHLDWLAFIVGTYSNDTKREHSTFYGKYSPDMSNGVKKIYVYCDEVDQSIVGDVKDRLLVTIPIKVEDQGSASLRTYSPPTIIRRLIKNKITAFHVQLHDISFTPILFSSGSLSIEAVIE
jgi:hypothetical protein